jgi:hypothetical protein
MIAGPLLLECVPRVPVRGPGTTTSGPYWTGAEMMLKKREPEPVKVSRYVILSPGVPLAGSLTIIRYCSGISPDGEVPWESYKRMEDE